MPGKCALLVGAEKVSGRLDYTDRGTCILFGDGARAAAAVASEDRWAPPTWGRLWQTAAMVLYAGHLLPTNRRMSLRDGRASQVYPIRRAHGDPEHHAAVLEKGGL